MSARRRTTVTAVLGAGAACLALLPAGGASAQPEQSGLAEVRQVTHQFHDVQAALDAGYLATDHCVPGMGYHYVNPRLFEDPGVDPLAPEVLLYAPSGQGVRLVGVEWVKKDADGDPATVETIRVLGQRLYGPMTHGLPLHYDLHAYVWRGNPNGVFATENPKVSCS